MSSIRNQIVDAVKAALDVDGKPAGVKVQRYSLKRIDFDKEPDQLVIEIHPGKDVPEPPRKGFPVLKRTLSLRVDCYGMGDPIDERLDPMLCWVTKVLGEEAPLGNLVLDVREGEAEWDEEAATMGVGLCKITFEIDYHHHRNNQETKP